MPRAANDRRSEGPSSRHGGKRTDGIQISCGIPRRPRSDGSTGPKRLKRCLGHAELSTTEIYAEKSLEAAALDHEGNWLIGYHQRNGTAQLISKRSGQANRSAVGFIPCSPRWSVRPVKQGNIMSYDESSDVRFYCTGADGTQQVVSRQQSKLDEIESAWTEALPDPATLTVGDMFDLVVVCGARVNDRAFRASRASSASHSVASAPGHPARECGVS